MGIFDFAAIRRSVLGIEDQLKKMQGDIDDLQRKREVMLSAPANKADVKDMLNAWIRRSGDIYRQSLIVTLKDFVRNPRNMTPQRLTNMISVAGAAQPFGDALRPKDVDQALCALFGPLLEAAISAQVDLLDWPDEGLLLAQRTIEAQKLNQAIAQIEKEYSELIQEAESAGIVWSRS